MKILSGELEPTSGHIKLDQSERLATLSQNQFAYEDVPILDCVIMGHKKLWEIKSEREKIYSLPNMTDEEGLRVADLEVEFSDMDGYTAESNAGELLLGVGIALEDHEKKHEHISTRTKIESSFSSSIIWRPWYIIIR